MELSVSTLRETFRNLHLFRSVFETEGVDLVVGPEGIEICLWDLEYWYEQLPEVLTPRQYQAIEYFLVQNLKESTVAEMMGISPTNPIGSYATAGLEKLIKMIGEGKLERPWVASVETMGSPPVIDGVAA